MTEHTAARARTRNAYPALLLSTAIAACATTGALAQSGDATSETRLKPVPVEASAISGFAIERPADEGYKASRSLTATKTDTALIDVPQAVSVVTRRQIEDQAIQTMADVVRYVPGVTFAQGEGNRDTPIFRGNSSTSDFFVDGIRDDTQYFRDLYNIERVEVFKGPNAMIFGRGGVGGVINRVTAQADWNERRAFRVEGGSDDHVRTTFDLGQPLSEAATVRLTGLYQDSGSYRDGVDYNRWGFNPTTSFRIGEDTLIQAGYEHFKDSRVADRGIPSLDGKPVETSRSTFFGDPDNSPTHTNVDAATLAVEHRFSDSLTLRNRTRYADYDKFYQNIFPGTVTAGTTVSISGYSNATQRETFINQTDLNANFATGAINHTLLVGAELGRQETDNFRRSAFFGADTTAPTSIDALVASPRVRPQVLFAQDGDDADNHGVAKFAAIYVQDQIEFSPQFQAVIGLRYDRFKVDFRNNRTGNEIDSTDNLWSPRAGLIFKPIENISLYASYSLTYLPRAGEQLSSLTASNEAFEPEEFKNYEIGVKWDASPDLNFTAAVYQLDRSNVVVTDPNDPAQSILVKGQRTKGIELGASGNITKQWSVIAAYAYQDGKLTTTDKRLANLPKHSASLWNRYDFTPALGAGVGIIYNSKRYASTDNAVSLPGYTRVDGALYYQISENLSAQVNVENLFDKKYFIYAHNNNNITPGSPRAFKVSLGAHF